MARKKMTAFDMIHDLSEGQPTDTVAVKLFIEQKTLLDYLEDQKDWNQIVIDAYVTGVYHLSGWDDDITIECEAYPV